MKKVLEPVIRSGFCLILILAAGAGCTRLTPHPEGKKCSKLEKRRVFIRQMEDPCRKKELLKTMANDPDGVIRQRVLSEHFLLYGDKAFPEMLRLVRDTDLYVMRTLIDCAKHLKDPALKSSLLSRIAKENPLEEFRCMARQANFPFQRETLRLKDDPSQDLAIETVRSIRIPAEGWRFTTDPAMEGHLKGFYKKDFSDSHWKKVKMGVWESQGFANYDGVGWYRIRFKMPPAVKHNSVELKFEAVDESAWVWLNGVYVGQHDKGPEGWDKTFHLDIRKEIRFGEENILTVRVLDTAGGGGIYLPVHVEILR
ncbi:MAG: beta galactosidase jelly roll domain-containing protein [Lentisphaeria bacterium]|nr:beta galactosidase jelly roll domain-containing protein [Lentisphaeria bacterium]